MTRKINKNTGTADKRTDWPKDTRADDMANQKPVLTAKGLIAQIDKALVELGKLTGYGPDYTYAKAKWTEIKAKFKAKASTLAQKQKAKAAGGAKKQAKKPTATVSAGTKDEPEKRPEPPKRDPQKAKMPRSAKITPHALECYLGSFPVEELARRDASDLLGNPRVFWYRRAMFPDPTAAKVQPKVMSAKVVERKGAQFARAPYTVLVDINIQGDLAHVKAWAEGVVNKNRGDQE